MRLFARMLLATTVAVVGLLAPAAVAPAAEPTPGNGIVNGRPATENYQFMVYVPDCSGSLVKANWVVTAKHCATPSSVRVGSTDRSSGGTVVSVLRGVSHPRIDVKLLELASPVTYAPAPIPLESGALGTPTRIIGWGLTCPIRGCGFIPQVANELDTSIVADGRCAGIDADFEICTNNTNGNAGACFGDSGGPQVRLVDGVWALVGVTSRLGSGNTSCATAPSIYGDLPSIRAWVGEQVGGLPRARTRRRPARQVMVQMGVPGVTVSPGARDRSETVPER